MRPLSAQELVTVLVAHLEESLVLRVNESELSIATTSLYFLSAFFVPGVVPIFYHLFILGAPCSISFLEAPDIYLSPPLNGE